MSTETATAIFYTAAACLIFTFSVLGIAAFIKESCYWKLVQLLYNEHREEWLREGKPDHVLLEGSMTGGKYRGGQYLFSKWLYSPPAWISASENLKRIHRRMCFWDNILKRIFVGLIIVMLLVLNSLVFVFGRMKKSEQGGADQPATSSESESEGEKRIEPKSEARPR